jgi:hypothetical protein
MKKLIWLVGISALASMSSVYAEEVDFRAANPVLQSLLDTVTSADDLVDFAYPRFDESYSDLKAEKLKYDVRGALKNTPWLPGGRAEATATSRYRTERTTERTGIRIEASAMVRTEVLAMIRYSANIALRKTPEHDLEPQFWPRYQAHLKRLAVVSSLDQVHALLLSGQKLAKDMFAHLLEEEIEDLRCLEAGTCTEHYNDVPGAIAQQKRTVADLKKSLAAYDLVEIVAKSEGGKVRELSICSQDIKLFIPEREIERQDTFLIPGKGCGMISDGAVSSSVDGFFKMPVEDLNKLKKDFETRMVGAQNGRAKDKDYLQKKFREALIDFKKAIRGEWK